MQNATAPHSPDSARLEKQACEQAKNASLFYVRAASRASRFKFFSLKRRKIRLSKTPHQRAGMCRACPRLFRAPRREAQTAEEISPAAKLPAIKQSYAKQPAAKLSGTKLPAVKSSTAKSGRNANFSSPRGGENVCGNIPTNVALNAQRQTLPRALKSARACANRQK
ncbi:MAG: hypothetical protein DBX55_01185 [Verrucomicrobia bacterium]|nr:MAG: hypothetical protein DBX55_01185 [Verrucomicrobiota bacterium]